MFRGLPIIKRVIVVLSRGGEAMTDLMVDEGFAPSRVAVLLEDFAQLDDEREPWRVMYPLAEVLLVLTCATVASCDDFEDIVAWGTHHLHDLRRFAPFHHGIPCVRWMRALVNRVDPVLFGACFETWVACGPIGTI